MFPGEVYQGKKTLSSYCKMFYDIYGEEPPAPLYPVYKHWVSQCITYTFVTHYTASLYCEVSSLMITNSSRLTDWSICRAGFNDF